MVLQCEKKQNMLQTPVSGQSKRIKLSQEINGWVKYSSDRASLRRTLAQLYHFYSNILEVKRELIGHLKKHTDLEQLKGDVHNEQIRIIYLC